VAEYVYGIVRAGAGRPRADGIGGAPLRLIQARDAAALVSRLADLDELRLGRDEVLTHARVLEAALSRGLVLPMRFGVVLDTADVRHRLLEPHADELRVQLDSFDGKIELRVRAVYDEERRMREIVHEDRDIARLRATLRGLPDDATYYDRIKLGELVAQAVERKRELDAADVIDALAPIASAVEVGDPRHARVVVNASFLVERARLAKFDEALERVAAAQSERIRFKCAGPLPPHSFVELAGSA
jgi:Gas vesicle synthesis protein GvpL/GvpF